MARVTTTELCDVIDAFYRNNPPESVHDRTDFVHEQLILLMGGAISTFIEMQNEDIMNVGQSEVCAKLRTIGLDALAEELEAERNRDASKMSILREVVRNAKRAINPAYAEILRAENLAMASEGPVCMTSEIMTRDQLEAALKAIAIAHDALPA